MDSIAKNTDASEKGLVNDDNRTTHFDCSENLQDTAEDDYEDFRRDSDKPEAQFEVSCKKAGDSDASGSSGGSADESESPVRDEDDIEEMNRYWPPPLADTVKVVGSRGSKTASAVAFNNAGTRFAVGGHDHEVRIWDFTTLDKWQTQPIASAQPCGATVINNISFSNDDERILVVSGSCQAVVMAKDGLVPKGSQCAKGDQYISDMTHTKGHTQMLNDGCWNPKEDSLFITCSNDCTVRIWDVNRLSEQRTVIKARSPRSGLKAVPGVCRYSRDALCIAVGCNDGTVLMWDTRRKFLTTSLCIKDAHLKGSEITGLEFSYASQQLICTRSEDETCKLWDTRKYNKPLAVCGQLNNMFSNVDCIFSPDDKYVITGTSCTKQEPGQVHFLEISDAQLESKHRIDVEDSSVARVRWHPKINHIVYTCSNGDVVVGYDRRRSLGGLLSAASGIKRKRIPGDGEPKTTSWLSTKIITPHSLPLFSDDSAKSKKRQYAPAVNPVEGAKRELRPAGSTLSSFIARNIARPKSDDSMDIRERILRHADAAAKDPKWVTPAPSSSKSNQDNK